MAFESMREHSAHRIYAFIMRPLLVNLVPNFQPVTNNLSWFQLAFQHAIKWNVIYQWTNHFDVSRENDRRESIGRWLQKEYANGEEITFNVCVFFRLTRWNERWCHVFGSQSNFNVDHRSFYFFSFNKFCHCRAFSGHCPATTWCTKISNCRTSKANRSPEIHHTCRCIQIICQPSSWLMASFRAY